MQALVNTSGKKLFMLYSILWQLKQSTPPDSIYFAHIFEKNK